MQNHCSGDSSCIASGCAPVVTFTRQIVVAGVPQCVPMRGKKLGLGFRRGLTRSSTQTLALCSNVVENRMLIAKDF